MPASTMACFYAAPLAWNPTGVDTCRSANANQMRLILHTAAYWLMWTLRQALPETAALRIAEFATIRLRLIKVAARIIETGSRIRVALASACPDTALFPQITLALRAASP